nr:hypothetical protein GCM10020093_040180 [Planobispora longispora]
MNVVVVPGAAGRPAPPRGGETAAVPDLAAAVRELEAGRGGPGAARHDVNGPGGGEDGPESRVNGDGPPRWVWADTRRSTPRCSAAVCGSRAATTSS